MIRKLTPRSSLEHLKREAKRWLAELRANDPDARARFASVRPGAPANPGLRDVQHALALEYGFSGWAALTSELRQSTTVSPVTSRDAAIQALLAAAERGDAARVTELLDAHSGIVSERATLGTHTGQRTALHFAMNRMNAAVVDVLLAHGADPNARDDGDNAMPLHFAAERGRLDIVRRLVEHGADPIGTGDLHELEVIGWATCFGPLHRHVAEYLLSHGARHTMGSAVALGVMDAIRDLAARAPAELDRPMDRVNHRRRPLHLAIIKQQAQSLATLLALGADMEAEDEAGLTPLDQAALSGERAMAQQLIDHGADLRLPAAVALERHDDIQRLLADDPDALRPGRRWGTLIIRASERASAAVIDALIRGGASVHVRDDPRTSVDGTHGYTALHAAAFRGNAGAVRALLAHGASPANREDKYWGTPAGWANYAGHTEVRDLILDGTIDIFDAMLFDRNDRLPGILARDPVALDRVFGEYVTVERASRPWLDPAWTPLAFAVANGKQDAVRFLIDRGANLSAHDSAGRTLVELARDKGVETIARLFEHNNAGGVRVRTGRDFEHRVADFLRLACLDWRVGGSQRAMAMHDAQRILERNPEIARANISTAVVCGDPEHVRHVLDDHPPAAFALGGPRSWPPLLYLCAARLPSITTSDAAVAIARLLLDHGADPNAFYLGGNADIHYTALTGVLGRGEEQASMHPAARELTRLLLERGADPFDGQVLYNVFGNHASRPRLDNDIVWLLESMREHSVRRRAGAGWADPTWPMFDLRGAPSLGDEAPRYHGARFMLEAAIDRNLLDLARWMLEHGAGPNVPATGHGGEKGAQHTLYQEALSRGYPEMAQLLLRHGAVPTPLVLEGYDALVDASLNLDRRQVRAQLARHPEYLTDQRALFLAVERDRADVVEMLLDAGISPNVEDPATHGRALHVAAYLGAERSAAVLIARGAEVDVRETRHHAIPLGVASWAQQAGMVELLGRYSRDVWELTYAGRVQRLHHVLREQPELARATLSTGDTPLMWLPIDATSALETASLLVEYGTDPAKRNAEGLTAGDVATSRGLDEVAALLRSRGG
ncbi:MAG TPA: ankyrin repeat domain-containing protein [Gemmatimonadaceae bacterium]|jgi:ankyrin repeat protein